MKRIYLTVARAIRDAEVFYSEGRQARDIVAESVADAIEKDDQKFDKTEFLNVCKEQS